MKTPKRNDQFVVDWSFSARSERGRWLKCLKK